MKFKFSRIAQAVFILCATTSVMAQTAQTETTLETIEVKESANKDLPAAYAGGQVAKGARVGALGNVDIMDTPFNVTSYTAELIENKSARTLADLLISNPAVHFTTSSGHAYENFRIRGFEVEQSDIAINGMYGLAPVGHVPLEMFERVEVLNGPTAVFSGMPPSGAVGGSINLVPKRAGEEPLTRVSLDYQSGSQFGTKFDLSRRLGEQKEWGIRVNGSFMNGETDLKGQDKKREFISAAVDYRNRGFKLSLDTYYSKESYTGGTAAMYWYSSKLLAAPDPSVNQFPGAWGELESKAAILRGEYEFNENVSAFAGIGVRGHDYAGIINGTHVRNINALGTSTTTSMTGMRGHDDAISSEAGLRFNFSTPGIKHDMVLQATRLESQSGRLTTNGTAYTTSIYNPTYRAATSVPATSAKTADNTFSSVALVDTMSFMEDKLRITAGVRNQNVESRTYSATTGATTAVYDKSAVTPAVGVVVKPWAANVSLYANYVEGLSKGDTITTATYVRNYTFAPYKTKQKEVGVKWDAGTFTNTASLFEISKPSLITFAVSGGLDATDGGEKRVRGLEWNTFGEVSRGVRLLGGASYNEGVQTKTQNGTYDGYAAVGVPTWQGNVGVEWDPASLSGVTFTGGMQSSSGMYLNSANTIKSAGWTIFNAGARYATNIFGRNTVVRLNVTNLFDKHYYSGSFSDSYAIATLGAGRTISASISTDF